MNFAPALLNTWAPNPTPSRGSTCNLTSNSTGSYLMYPSGKSLVVRSFDSPSLAVTYSSRRPITASTFSHNDPTFLACADQTGAVHQLKLNSNLLSTDSVLTNIKDFNSLGIGGQIFDMCFTSDDKNFLVGGDSAGKNGRVFSLSGATLGGDNNTNLGSAKRILSVAASHTTALKQSVLLTATEDWKIKPYIPARGGSFKITSAKTIKQGGPVSMVRFHPEDACILSCGGKDIMINSFDPSASPEEQTFGLVKKIKGGAKSGRIYAVAFCQSGDFMRVGADKVVKLYDASGNETNSYDLNGSSFHKEKVMDFQVGCTYAGQYPVSMSLAGDLIYFDSRQAAPTRIVSGSTAALADISIDDDGSSFGAISMKGEVLLYSGIQSGDVSVSRAKNMAASKTGAGVVKSGNMIFSTSNADNMQTSEAKSDGSLNLNPGALPLGAKPMYTRKFKPNCFVVSTVASVFIMDSGKTLAIFDKAANGLGEKDISCAAVNPGMDLLVVGFKDRSIKFYDVDISSKKFTERTADAVQMVENYGSAQSMTFTKKGNYLAIGCTKCIKLYEVSGKKLILRSGVGVERWEGHSGKVLDLDFGGANENWLLSSETNIKVLLWDVSKHEEAIPQLMDRPHGTSFINRVRWVSETEFVTVGQDNGDVKKWRV